MPDDATPRLGLPLLAAAQAQKHVTMNECLARLDGLVHLRALSRTRAAQPAEAAEGDLYILPPGATGSDWAPWTAGSLLLREGGAWTAAAAAEGMVAWVVDEARILVRASGAWTPLGSLLGSVEGLSGLGVGAASDADKAMVAKLSAALFTAADGGAGDVRLKLNKRNDAAVGSLLLQSGFSGRAELGLVGDDRLTVKTSADGATWSVALSADAHGVVALPAKPMLSVFKTGGDQLPVGAGEVLSFESVRLDTASGFNVGSGRYTCPAAGRYRVSGAVTLSPDSTGIAFLAVRVNGTFAHPGWLLVLSSQTGTYVGRTFDLLVQVAAGDLVDVFVLPSAPGSTRIYGTDTVVLNLEHLG